MRFNNSPTFTVCERRKMCFDINKLFQHRCPQLFQQTTAIQRMYNTRLQFLITKRMDTLGFCFAHVVSTYICNSSQRIVPTRTSHNATCRNKIATDIGDR